jgi:SNF2 family DNA or RNA helicase
MILDTPNDRVFLRVRNPQAIRKYLPGLTEEVDWKKHNLAVEHTLDTTRVLRNIGIPVPSPIRHKYHWPGPYKPFKHQIETSEFLTLHRKGFVLNEMGTSKTASALWAADYLMNAGEVKGALVVGPLSTLVRVWRDEAFRFVMHRTAVVLHGNQDKRLRLLQSGADFYIINYEGLEIIERTLKARPDINLIIIDEAAAYRNAMTERYKTLTRIIQPYHRLWLMTGTPCPNAPTDAYALAKLVDKSKVPVYFSSWRSRVMQQVTTYKWKPREGSEHAVFEALQPAVRFRKRDCIDLPPVTYESRECELSKEQLREFRRMKNFFVAEVGGKEVSAVNAADKISKLRQILCGSMRDPDTGEYVVLPHEPRLRVLKECIEQASAKVLVIVPYKGITRALMEELENDYACAIVNGDVSATKRNEIFRRFKEEKDPHLLLCHPQVMAHGLTLTEADMLIFYAPIYSNEQDQQVMERINRPGQTRPMTIIRIGGHSLEWQIYQQVEGRKVSQETILDLYNRTLKED